MTDYMNKIATAITRQEAALYVRAIACQQAATLYACHDPDRLRVIDAAERLASSLERDYSLDGDTPCAESRHPWRAWLREAGYPGHEAHDREGEVLP